MFPSARRRARTPGRACGWRTRARAREDDDDSCAREKRAGMICETEQFPFAETCNARAELPQEFHATRRKEEGRKREIGSARRTEVVDGEEGGGGGG